MAEPISWPKALEQTIIKDNIEKVFRATDDPTEEGSNAVGECFASDGEMVTKMGTFRGREEIINFRRASWDPVTFRDHELQKVYLSDSDHNDVVVIGRVTLGTVDGQKVEEGFAMSLLFNDDGLIRKFEAWFDSAPVRDMITKARS